MSALVFWFFGVVVLLLGVRIYDEFKYGEFGNHDEFDYWMIGVWPISIPAFSVFVCVYMVLQFGDWSISMLGKGVRRIVKNVKKSKDIES